MKLSLALLLAVVLLSGSHCFAGLVSNDSFESAFASWAETGNTSIETAAFGVPPPNLLNQALLNTGNGGVGDNSVTVANLESFLNLTGGTLATVGPTPAASRGSAIKQSISGVSIGDTLSFSWNFVTAETPPAIGTDFAFFSISRTGGSNSASLLANTSSGLVPFAGGGFTAQTVYALGGFTFLEAGDYTIGFGVVNSPDAFIASGLLVDSVNTVPEPSALAGLGLLSLVGLLRRRRR